MSSFKFTVAVCLLALVTLGSCAVSDDLEVLWDPNNNQMMLANVSVTNQYWLLTPLSVKETNSNNQVSFGNAKWVLQNPSMDTATASIIASATQGMDTVTVQIDTTLNIQANPMLGTESGTLEMVIRLNKWNFEDATNQLAVNFQLLNIVTMDADDASNKTLVGTDEDGNVDALYFEGVGTEDVDSFLGIQFMLTAVFESGMEGNNTLGVTILSDDEVFTIQLANFGEDTDIVYDPTFSLVPRSQISISSTGKGPNIALIVGVSIAIALVVIILIVIGVVCYKKNAKKEEYATL